VKTSMSAVRVLAWGAAVAFAAATVLQIADYWHLFLQPPNLPETTNLVDRVLGTMAYRTAIWPVFFATGLLFGAGFLALAGLGVAFADRLPAGNRRVALAGSLLLGGILGTVGQLVLVGATKASIDIAYCDCGFKEQEIVSQVWAVMVAQSASEWLVNGATIVAVLAFVAARRLFDGTSMAGAWRTLCIGIALVVLADVAVGLFGRSDELENALRWLLTGALVPIWAIWLGLRHEGISTSPVAAA
jgi:hypothetical protein